MMSLRYEQLLIIDDLSFIELNGRWSEIISMLYSIFTQKYPVVEVAV